MIVFDSIAVDDPVALGILAAEGRPPGKRTVHFDRIIICILLNNFVGIFCLAPLFGVDSAFGAR